MAKRVKKIILLAAVMAALWFLWLFLYARFGVSIIFCPINRITGLYCPGCGTMRALNSLMHLDFAAAFRYNPFFIIILPFLLFLLLLNAYTYIRYARKPKGFKGEIVIAIILVVCALIFGILRNFPAFHFLAPHV